MDYVDWKCFVRMSIFYRKNKSGSSDLLAFREIDVSFALITTALSIKIDVSNSNDFHPLPNAKVGAWMKSWINQSCDGS